MQCHLLELLKVRKRFKASGTRESKKLNQLQGTCAYLKDEDAEIEL